MKLTQTWLEQIIQEEFQKMLFEAGCPPGTTSSGNQCVGEPAPLKKTDVFTVAAQGPGKTGPGGYSGTETAPTQDASGFEINRAKTAKLQKQSADQAAARDKVPGNKELIQLTPEQSKSIDTTASALSNMGRKIV